MISLDEAPTSSGLRGLAGAATELIPPALALLASLVIGGIVVGLALHSWTMPFRTYGQLAAGAFGNWYDAQESLTASTTLIFAALAVVIAFRAGLFNLGVEGQMYAGAIFSTFIGITLSWPGYLMLPLCVIASAAAGAIWALIPALARVMRGTHEIVTTFMLNYVALFLMHYLLSNTGTPGPLAGSVFQGNSSPPVNARFPVIVPGFLTSGGQLNVAFILALAASGAVWFLLSRTSFGFRLRVVGLSHKAAEFAGVRTRRVVVLSMLISGALAGLAGSALVFGVGGQLQDTWDGFGTGFEAIAVALLGRNTPLGALLVAIVFGAMDQGGLTLQLQGLADANIVVIIQGLVMFFVACEAAFGPLGKILKASLFSESEPHLSPT